jgi:hypothetical protein
MSYNLDVMVRTGSHLVRRTDLQFRPCSIDGSVKGVSGIWRMIRAGEIHMRLPTSCVHYTNDVRVHALLYHLSLVSAEAKRCAMRPGLDDCLIICRLY